MSYFNDDFLRFFKDLAKNNNKEWFDKNRKRYEDSVKKPFAVFVSDMIRKIAAEDNSVRIQAKDAVFRINNDIRFSKDKLPYKTHAAAIISSRGRKDHSEPGIYLQLSPGSSGIYGGAYMLTTQQLQNVREAIASDLKGFEKVIHEKKFRDAFSGILGEKNKRIPKELAEAAKKQPLLFNKQFYFHSKMSDKTVTDPKLPDVVMEHWRSCRQVNEFLKKAINGN